MYHQNYLYNPQSQSIESETSKSDLETLNTESVRFRMSSKKLAEEVSKRIFAGCAGRINNKNPLLRKPLSKQTHITSYVFIPSLVDVDFALDSIIYHFGFFFVF